MKHMALSIFSIIVFSASLSFAQRTFTDDDLEKYKRKSDGNIESPAENTAPRALQEIRPAVAPAPPSADQDKFAWCRRGQEAKDREKRALANVSRARGGSPEVQVAAIAARDELTAAQIAKKSLEEEAQLRGIPPGWLNCNFN